MSIMESREVPEARPLSIWKLVRQKYPPCKKYLLFEMKWTISRTGWTSSIQKRYRIDQEAFDVYLFDLQYMLLRSYCELVVKLCNTMESKIDYKTRCRAAEAKLKDRTEDVQDLSE